MPIGDPITPPLPVVGEAGTGYASKLLAFLEEVKLRLEAEVPVTALLEGTFDEANNPIVNLRYGHLYDQNGAATPPTGSLYRIGGNLWWVSASGAFQITNGAALNATSVKGFTGDYGSPNPAEARFVDLDQRYNFYDDYAGAAWAYVRARGFDVAGGATSLNRVRIAFGGVADYTLTLPAAVPASQVLMQMTAGGAITLSNTLPVDTDIVLSGTGKIKHGEYTIAVPATTSHGVARAGTFAGTAGQFGVDVDNTSLTSWVIPNVNAHWRIRRITAHLSAAKAVHINWGSYNISGGGVFTDGAGSGLLAAATAPSWDTGGVTAANYMQSTAWLYVTVDSRFAGAGAFRIIGFTITYEIV